MAARCGSCPGPTGSATRSTCPLAVRLLGSGPESILIKEPSVSTKLAASSDWYDQEITLADARGFQVGDGVCLRAKNPDTGGPVVIKRTLVARSGNRFKLDKALRENLWLEKGEPTAATLFPLISAENISDVVIENLALDGNRANNENLDGNYAGCIFAQDCNRLTFRGVIARNNNGDGISWQICHDVLVEDCQSHDHAGLGLHPGSGSQRPIMRNNQVRRSEIGIFFCWGVRFGLAEHNTIEDIRSAGISIGHRDTDNLVRDNTITPQRQGRHPLPQRDPGVRRPPQPYRAQPHRRQRPRRRHRHRRPRPDRVRHPGPATRSARPASPCPAIGIRIGAKAKDVSLAENRIEGFSSGGFRPADALGVGQPMAGVPAGTIKSPIRSAHDKTTAIMLEQRPHRRPRS